MKEKEFFCCENKRRISQEDCGSVSCDDCYTKQFWMEILEEKEKHFVSDRVHSRVGLYSVRYLQYDLNKEGGFYDSLYRVELEDGTVYEKVKLWDNGFAPNNYVIKELGFGKVIPIKGEE